MSNLTPTDPDGRKNPVRHSDVPTRPGFPEGSGLPGGPGEVSDDSVELRELLGRLRRHALWILLAGTAGVSLALFLVSRESPVYQSSAVIRLSDARQTLTGGLDGMMGQPALSRLDPIQSQIQVLQSMRVLGEVVDREGLRLHFPDGTLSFGDFADVVVSPLAPQDTLWFRFDESGVGIAAGGSEASAGYGSPLTLGGVTLTVPRPPGVEEAIGVILHRQRAVENLRRDLTVRHRDYTDVVEVSIRSGNPEVAERITNAVVGTFQESSARVARMESERRRVFVEERLAQADSILTQAQSTLSDFRTREGVYSSQEWFAAQQAGLLEVEMRREEMDASRTMYRSILGGIDEAELGQVSRRLQAVAASPEVAENPVVADLFLQLSRYEAARDSLVSGPWGASAANPDVRSLDEQIASTTRRLEDAIQNHVNALDARVTALDDLRGRAQRQIAALPSVEAEEARLIQQVESLVRTVDQLREEYQRALISEAVEVGQVEIVDWASVPLEPEGTGRMFKLVLGAALGLMAGVGGALLVSSLNTKINRREEMERLLQLPSIGIVPRLPKPAGAVGNGKGGARGLLGRKGKVPGSELITLRDARSPQAEAYRTIRTNLLFSDSIRALRALVVTSPNPSEGKSTTASNLAVAYAQQGMKVLLVDCDLRKARLHEVFALPRQPGFTDYILGEADWEESCRETPEESLHFLPAGKLPPNPSEFLGGARMREAVEHLKGRYEVVIFDSPPLMAGADAAILGSMADGVLLVVRAGRTDREAGQQAVRQLHTVGARILGAVLNDPDGELPRYSSYYANQYKYYAQPNED